MLETYFKMMRASGIPVKAKPVTKEIMRFEVFEEILDVGLGKTD